MRSYRQGDVTAFLSEKFEGIGQLTALRMPDFLNVASGLGIIAVQEVQVIVTP
jgi:hypothetical protein